MKIKSLFVCFILCLCQSIFAQESNEYLGGIKLNDTSLIPYKIKFVEKNGKIEGYSLTDFGGEHETKSVIIGKYDAAENLLSFQETKIIYTKSTISQDDFCNVYFQPSKFRLGKTKSFKGPFKGKFSDGEECINGEIYLNSKENIDKQMERVNAKVERSKKINDSIKDELRNMKIMDSVNLNVLKKDQITSVFTSSKKIKFLIYDGGKIDKDIITVLKDGKIILLNHEISEKREVIEFQLVSKKTTLTIIANSVGSIGTNTTVIEIIDDANNIKTLTSLKKDEKTSIDILRR
jgi:hypothetical protein